jgi:hypothetical protein
MLQERWAEPNAELASKRPGAAQHASVGMPEEAKLADGSKQPQGCQAAGIGGPKRFLPFSTGPRQCALRHPLPFHRLCWGAGVQGRRAQSVRKRLLETGTSAKALL